jgi:hypothetical protein
VRDALRRSDLRGTVVTFLVVLGLALVVPPPALVGPASAVAAECEGDECQAPPPAPDDPIPGTAAVNGPSNPPVRFPAHHGGKKRHPNKGHHRRSQGRR